MAPESILMGSDYACEIPDAIEKETAIDFKIGNVHLMCKMDIELINFLSYNSSNVVLIMIKNVHYHGFAESICICLIVA